MKPKRIMIESAMYELKQDLKLYGKPLLLTAMVLVAMQLIFHELCPMKILLGIPCPGCGLTHACLDILTLHWKKAWNWNPAGFLWVPSILLLLWMRYIKQHRIKYVFAFFWFTVGMTLLYYVINFGNIIAEYKAL